MFPRKRNSNERWIFYLFFELSWSIAQAMAMTSAAISSGRHILILSCFWNGGTLQSPRCARQWRPTCPAAQCQQNGGHSGCFSLVTLVIPWQYVWFGGLTEKYDMVLWLWGECSNKDGEPCWTLRWNARSISLVRVWWMHSCRAYLHTQILIWLVFPNIPAHRFLPANHICLFLFTLSFLLCIKEIHSTLQLCPSSHPLPPPPTFTYWKWEWYTGIKLNSLSVSLIAD